MTASSSPVVAAMARKRGSDYRWTKAEERTLRSMREAKATWEEIAAAIPGRTERAIRHRAHAEEQVAVAAGAMNQGAQEFRERLQLVVGLP